MFTVRKERCTKCGKEFEISLSEFIYKLDNGMHLPKNCKKCRRQARKNPDPYVGIYSAMRQYPLTKGHSSRVHGTN